MTDINYDSAWIIADNGYGEIDALWRLKLAIREAVRQYVEDRLTYTYNHELANLASLFGMTVEYSQTLGESTVRTRTDFEEPW